MEQQDIYRTAQEYLTQEGIPGWLVYDYRKANPVFWQVITPSGHVTRPCYFYLPATGNARLLIHHVDAGKFAESGVDLTVYSSRDSMLEALRALFPGLTGSPWSIRRRMHCPECPEWTPARWNWCGASDPRWSLQPT